MVVVNRLLKKKNNLSRFVVVNVRQKPFFEKTWAKYRARISRTKRVYTLTGELSNDAVDDYNAD